MAFPLSLVWDLVVRDGASAGFNRVSASADRAAVATGRATASTERAGVAAEANSKKMHGMATALGAIIAVDLGAHMVKSAAQFQQQTNVLVTAAGESTKNLKMVRQGILDIASSTGTKWQDVTAGLYQLEKAGYRGAAALKVETAAAQGAREEGANLATVTAAMTSMMASYHLPASKAVMVMNEMKTAAGESKTTMEAFAGSLSTVLPLASANKVAFADVAGVLATLTQHGTSADQATQEMANSLRNLSAPNMVAVKEMAQLGISSVDVADKLGDGPGGRGYAGTLKYLAQVVHDKMGGSNHLILSTLNASKVAAHDATVEFGRLAPATQKVAKGFIDGTITQHQWTLALRDMTPQQSNLAKQFAVTENVARGFQQQLRNGVSVTQTSSDALKKMAGGANGLNVILQATGESMKGTEERIKRIQESAKMAGQNVSGWASTQKLLAVQLDMFKQRLEVIGIQIGTALIPFVQRFLAAISGLFSFISAHSTVFKVLAVGILGVAAAIKVATLAMAIQAKIVAFVEIMQLAGTRIAAFFGSSSAKAALASREVAASQAAQSRAVTMATTEQIAALERLILAQNAVAVSAQRSSLASVRAYQARTLASAETAVMPGALGGATPAAGSRFAGAGGPATLGAIGAYMGYNAGASASHGNKIVATLGAIGGAPTWLGQHSAGLLKDWFNIGKVSSAMRDLITVSKNAKPIVDAFTASILAQGGTLGADTEAAAQAALAHTGLAAKAKAAGLTTKDLTDAISGNEAAYQKVIAAWRAGGSPSDAALRTLRTLHLEFGDAAKAAQKYADVHGTVIASEVKTASQTAVLSGKLGNLNTMHLTGAAVAAIFNRNVQNVTSSIAANGRTLDANTSFGQHNIAAIRQAATTALEHAQAVYQQTGSLKLADAALTGDRAKLMDAARAAGLNADQVRRLANAIYTVPKNRHSKITVDTAAAMRTLSNFSSFYDNFLAGISAKHIPGPVIGPATGPGMKKGLGGLIGASPPHARGGSVADGWFTAGEGNSNTWELGLKQGSKLDFYSNAQSKAMTGMSNPPGYAAGTNPGGMGGTGALIAELRRITAAVERNAQQTADALNSVAAGANLRARTMPAGRVF